jgi:hypothetical protein|tara:strand:- start:1802 stop:2050 length:249 start_codon:yes stop_codon:yes gene_type:complete
LNRQTVHPVVAAHRARGAAFRAVASRVAAEGFTCPDEIAVEVFAALDRAGYRVIKKTATQIARDTGRTSAEWTIYDPEYYKN